MCLPSDSQTCVIVYRNCLTKDKMDYVIYNNFLLYYKISRRLNDKKISILEEISKECSPSVLKKIVLENPFLLNRDPIHDSFLNKCNCIHPRIAEKIDKILQMKLHDDDILNILSNGITSMEPPLDMVAGNYTDKDLYDAVHLLVTCGADVNARNICDVTPLNSLCRRNNDRMGIKTFRFVLKKGKNADVALEYEDMYDVLHIAISTTLHVPSKIRVAKLLLEFGAKPRGNTLIEILDGKILRKEKCDVMKLIKLFMQYLLINIYKHDLVKTSKLAIAAEYDEILDLSCCSYSICYNEVIRYRNTLIKELNALVHHKIDKKTSLFSFISTRCCSGLRYAKDEEPLLHKIFTVLQLKQYISCYDLFYASVKRAAMIPILCSLCIFVRKPSNEIVSLNSYTVLHLAAYMSRRDIFNLIQVFWINSIKNVRIEAGRSLRKRTIEICQNQTNKTIRCGVTPFSVPFKRVK